MIIDYLLYLQDAEVRKDGKMELNNGKPRNDFNKNTTMRSRVRHYIHEQIRNGTFKPGERIVETQLAKELNISQAPVREALLELSMMGLLEERPYSGTFVRKLTHEEIDDIYNMRAFLEEYAATRAAKRITDDLIEEFDATLAAMDEATAANDLDGFADADIRFHELVIDAACSPALKKMWTTLSLAEWTNITLMATESSLEEITRSHRAIFDHIKRHADHSAGAEMFLHIRGFVYDLEKYYKNQEERNADNN